MRASPWHYGPNQDRLAQAVDPSPIYYILYIIYHKSAEFYLDITYQLLFFRF